VTIICGGAGWTRCKCGDDQAEEIQLIAKSDEQRVVIYKRTCIGCGSEIKQTVSVGACVVKNPTKKRRGEV
jgi:GTP cyclohydrolase II